MEEIKTDSTPFIAAALSGLLARSKSNIGDRDELTFYGEEIIEQSVLIGNLVAKEVSGQKLREIYFKKEKCNQSISKKQTSTSIFQAVKALIFSKTN